MIGIPPTLFSVRALPPPPTFADSADVSILSDTITLTPALGAPTAGQVLVATLAVMNQAVTAVPAGWTLLGLGSMIYDAEDNQMFVYLKVAGVGEPVSYTWTLAAPDRCVGIFVSYNGANAVQPDVGPTFGSCNTVSVNTCTAPSVVMTTSGILIAAFLPRVTTGTGFIFSGPPAPGMTLREQNSQGGAIGVYRQGLWDEAIVATGPTGVRTCTTTNSPHWLTMSLGLASA